jgi:hypothetical protein
VPKRSNEFQALIHKIESLLHDKAAKVEESAMVLNTYTGKHQEIDILVTFEVGGQIYRTGFQVRQRSRDKSGPGWINELSQQRIQCQLDRMVAVHSHGFTSTAKEIANRLDVKLIELSAITDELIQEALLVVDAVHFYRVRFHYVGYQSHEEWSPSDSAKVSKLHIPGRTPLDPSKIQDLLDPALRREVESSEFTEAERRHLETGKLVEMKFRVPLAPGSFVALSSGNQYPVSHMVGKAEMQRIHAQFDEIQVLDYGGRPVLVGDDPNFDGQSQLVIVPDNDGDFKVKATFPLDTRGPVLKLEFPEIRVEELSYPAAGSNSV